MSWKTIDHGTSVDVVPVHDDKEHGYGDECWCNPTVEQTRGVPLITHNALRENKTIGDKTMREIEVVVIYKDEKHMFRFKPRLGKWSTQLDVSDDLTVFVASPATPDGSAIQEMEGK